MAEPLTKDLVSKKDRQRATAAMVKCSCGNVASRASVEAGVPSCNRCEAVTASEDALRERFEQWAMGLEYYLARDDDGVYADDFARVAWEGFKAGAA